MFNIPIFLPKLIEIEAIKHVQTAAKRIDILTIFKILSSPKNAISDTKIDIVKPIPASIPTHIMSYHLTSLGFSITLNLDKTDVNKNIPKGFPTTNPTIIPKTTCNEPSGIDEIFMFIAVLENANNGSIIKLAYGANTCSILINVHSRVSLLHLVIGNVIANRTPLIVACIPLENMQSHKINPSIK